MDFSIKPLLLAASVASFLCSPAVNAYEAGDVIFRADPTTVAPNDDSGMVGEIAGSKVKVTSNTQLGLSISYLYTDNIGLELLAATPFEHDVKGGRSLKGIDIGSLKHLPPH